MSGDILVVSKPLVHQLDEYLSPLVHWQTFGIHLPHITNSTIEQIEADHQGTERRKLALYARWLTEYSDATWDHVYDALKKARQHELASVLQRKLLVSHSAKQLEVEERKVEVKIDTVDEMATKLVGLHKRFAQLETTIKGTLESIIIKGQKTIKDIARHLQRHLEETRLKLTDAKDIDDLFDKLESHYSFLNCELLEEIINQFAPGELQTELEKYVTDVEAFEELTTLQELKDAIEQALLPTQSVTPSTCEVILKVSKRWKREKMKCLNKLLEHIFSDKSHLLKHIKITVGSMCIRFLVPKSQVEMLIALATEHMEFMYLLGVFEMMINDIPVLMKEEDKSFTFDSALLESSQSGNNEAVQFLLDLGVIINYRNSEGKTALLLASEAGHEEVVRTLVSGGANVNLQDNTGHTALMDSKTKEIFSLLLQSNADINILTYRGSTPLIAACGLGHLSLVEMLLVEYNNDPNVQNKEGNTAIMLACRNGHQQVVELLLEKQVDLNDQNNKLRTTALMQASLSGHYQVVELLLKSGADPNVHDNDGWTALTGACQNGHQQVVELLLEKQVDPNVQNSKHGRTALIQACQNGHYQVVEILLQKGADPNIHDNDGWTALIVASQFGHYQVVEILLKKGADPNIRNENGETALIVASQFGHYQVVEILLEKGADPNIHDNDGWTALIVGSEKGHQQVVELLLEKQVDPNVQNSKNGRTALIQGSQGGHYQVVDKLLQKGADPNVHDNNGGTALMYSSMEGHSDIIEVLLRYNANTHYFVTIVGVSLDSLALAAMSGNIECLNILLKHTDFSLKSLSMAWYIACLFGHVPIITFLSNRLDIVSDQRDLITACAEGDLGSVVDQLMSGKVTSDVQFIHGVTPLMISSSCGHTDIVEALIQSGTNVNKTDEFGHTALDFAEGAEQDATKNILLQHGGSKGPGPESESHETTSEEQKLSTDTSQSTIKSSQGSLSIRKKELEPKKRPFLIKKKLFKDTVKYSQSIFSQHQHFDNREYSTTTHIPIL